MAVAEFKLRAGSVRHIHFSSANVVDVLCYVGGKEIVMKDLKAVEKFAKDLRREEPRSPSEKLAGYEKAARCVDKCRATLVGWQGEFVYGCPMDRSFLDQAGVGVEEFRQFIGTGVSDAEVEKWLSERRK
jgi:hypothetical protein